MAKAATKSKFAPKDAAPAASKAPKAAPASTGESKSIVNPKYRDRYKSPDWLSRLITDNTATTKVVTRREIKTDETGEKTRVQKDVTVPDKIDIDALFELAKENGIDTAKYAANRSSNGFAGRFRMTLRNILHAKAKKTHGLFVNGKWVKADPEWLNSNGAPEEPTHSKQGEPLVKKAPKAEKTAA